MHAPSLPQDSHGWIRACGNVHVSVCATKDVKRRAICRHTAYYLFIFYPIIKSICWCTMRYFSRTPKHKKGFVYACIRSFCSRWCLQMARGPNTTVVWILFTWMSPVGFNLSVESLLDCVGSVREMLLGGFLSALLWNRGNSGTIFVSVFTLIKQGMIGWSPNVGSSFPAMVLL